MTQFFHYTMIIVLGMDIEFESEHWFISDSNMMLYSSCYCMEFDYLGQSLCMSYCVQFSS